MRGIASWLRSASIPTRGLGEVIRSLQRSDGVVVAKFPVVLREWFVDLVCSGAALTESAAVIGLSKGSIGRSGGVSLAGCD